MNTSNPISSSIWNFRRVQREGRSASFTGTNTALPATLKFTILYLLLKNCSGLSSLERRCRDDYESVTQSARGLFITCHRLPPQQSEIPKLYTFVDTDLGTGIPGRHPGGIAEDTLPGWLYIIGYPGKGMNGQIIRRVRKVFFGMSKLYIN
jgi:hypothetical protein